MHLSLLIFLGWPSVIGRSGIFNDWCYNAPDLFTGNGGTLVRVPQPRLHV